jgi:hypothetical protein
MCLQVHAFCLQEPCMTELSIAEYAARLGLSADTVRRRIRADQIPHRADGRGRYVVIMPDEDPMQMHAMPRQDADAHVLEREVLHATALAAAERRHGDELAATVALLREQLEARAKAEEELRVLLLRQTEQLTRLLPAPQAEPLTEEVPPAQATEAKATGDTGDPVPEPEQPRRKGWRSWLVWQR